MRPAFSVVFLTTLCGAAQGLLLTLVIVEALARAAGVDIAASFYVTGAALSVALGALGLLASFFHLGHPERAWRAIAMWRTSWLSRECIALPVFLACAFAYGAAHLFGWPGTLLIGALGALASGALFVCTAMIYACLRFLQEWASPLTLVNFVLLGCASGCTLATACAAWLAPSLVGRLAVAACVLTLAGGVARLASLARNARLRPKSTVQSATGIRSEKVEQKSRGFTASAFNTREFFHGQGNGTLHAVRVGFLIGAFAVPFVLTGAGALAPTSVAAAIALGAAFVIQYAGLVAERWFFFADARHPQNIYYQRAS
ncbi:DMSO reductase [Burkholderia contaminans FFH2055]|uniref:dimethyl sulfoxide reductase anchor subunit family protein n=1 Tax=Burkholderia contaminans TaxID=488447 RepID=UPI00062595D4|nr:DmsC/YnfH family molybdoenzyme membrane anchor subunit [Burkholderia contaminans]KKL30113.1 DMSO reductase [Burkholderia contaminans FFH2055]MEB4629625.1 dimethyl sulfoxide reductase anchor subunit [Burkholderia contaminans]MEB4635808.1 dimethyl sulfoxide reductase anchor subunit [Burkholderia contaminans]MEB4650971.1 dimethyl sulfoxide reductase anchor subunit [Burkholderia contaminans]MEB4662138.1 dimethyl sulfoxide reductase anchor subunit [Burkholderia contaminans]